MKRIEKFKPIYLIVLCFVIVCVSVVMCMLIYFDNNMNYSSLNVSPQFALSVFIMLALFLLLTFFLYFYYTKTQSEITKQLQLEKERYKTIIEHSNWNIWEYSFDTKLVSNRSSKDFTPILADKLMSNLIDKKILYPGDLDVMHQFFSDFTNGINDLFAQVRLKYSSNDYNWYEITGTTLYDKENKPYLTIAKTVNIDKQKKELDRLKKVTERDSLTNLYNFRTIKSKIKDIITSNSHKDVLCSVLIIDIDDFTTIIDTYGNMFANAILIDFANRLNERINDTDLAAYIVDSKFVVFLDNIESVSYCQDIAANINTILDESCLGELSLELSCSVGIAVSPTDADNIDDLLENANIALCFSKLNGRKNISMYKSSYRSIIKMDEYVLSGINNSNFKHVRENRSIIDSNIVFDIVDILFEAKDFEYTFNMALLMIGNYYSLDQIGIFEQSDNGNYLKMTYSWNSKDYEPFEHHLKVIAKNDSEKFAFYKASYTGVYATDCLDKEDLKPSSFKDLVNESGMKCLFQCSINDKNDFKGYIFARSLTERDDWSSNFVDSLTLLSKIIGGYLAKYRSQQNKDKLIQIDHLTKANNLKSFIDIVSNIIASNTTQKYVMIYLDINKFKLINETFGYETGDYILVEFTKKLSAILDENETFGRVVDDKFVVFAKYFTLERLKKRMLEFKDSVNLIKKSNSDNYNMSIAAGLFLVTNYDNISIFIDRANIARKSIKDRHHSTYAFFNEAMKRRMLKQKDLENVMDIALKNNEFCVFFQPKYSLYTNAICGAEALVRWNRPDFGIIPPNEFIPIFEENAFIIEIDYFIFEKVCEFIRYLLDNNFTPVPISVNFSRLHLNNTKILSKLKYILNKYDLTPKYLEIEITEYALVESNSYMASILHEIKRLGFKLAMDDFGSGVSSLNSLRKQPFDILKLDKDFFQKDHITDKERIVISNIVRLAKELNMEIVAEGVETEEQNIFLREIDCPIIQGFVFSKPIPQEEFMKKYFS